MTPLPRPSPIALQRRAMALGLAAFVAAPWHRARGNTRTLRILVGYPPGGSVDIVARKLADVLGRHRPVVVENRPGAAGRLAVDALRAQAGDEQALVLTPASVLTLYPHVFRQLGYDPFTDLTPVCTVAVTGFALAVGPVVASSVASPSELVAWCRQNPQRAQCGNAGMGSLPHLLAVWLARDLQLDLSHIPYRGGSDALQAVAKGEVAMALGTESAVRSGQASGRVRPIATLWPGRSPFLPDTPSFQVLGWPAMVQKEWFGLFFPAGVSNETAQALALTIQDALASQRLREVWAGAGLLPDHLPPQRLRDAMKNEFDFWGPLVKTAGFSPQS